MRVTIPTASRAAPTRSIRPLARCGVSEGTATHVMVTATMASGTLIKKTAGSPALR
jgi:hypothetical protein